MNYKYSGKIKELLHRTARFIRGSSGHGASIAFRPTSAQALLEFVLVTIPMLITMVGIFEFGLLYNDVAKLDFTTREVTRILGICSNGCDSSDNYNLASSSSGKPIPYDIAALAFISASDNPAPLTPENINYIHLQRTSIDGSLSVSLTGTTYISKGSSLPVDVYTTYGSDGNRLGMRPFYAHYVYTTTQSTFAPYVSDDSYVPAGVSLSQLPYNYRGWPSKGYDSGKGWVNGRNVCEPTDRFYVEISYKHKWITPLVPWTGSNSSINLTRRVPGKIEPLFFQGTQV
ncbi:MAG: pilus assembly protein [Chloroflexi bacterium]|nr:pilus assembly protein [Chloroflexota bacterium]